MLFCDLGLYCNTNDGFHMVKIGAGLHIVAWFSHIDRQLILSLIYILHIHVPINMQKFDL